MTTKKLINKCKNTEWYVYLGTAKKAELPMSVKYIIKSFHVIFLKAN